MGEEGILGQTQKMGRVTQEEGATGMRTRAGEELERFDLVGWSRFG